MKVTKQDLMMAQATLDDLPQMLTEMRKRSGITQQQLGDRLGVSAHQVSSDENGGYNGASLDRLRRVAEALVELLNKK